MAESDQIKRLRMRSWRRGTKEMDMILGPFSDVTLSDLDAPDLEIYEALLHENDQDLYQWVSAQLPAPDHFEQIVSRIRAYLAGR